MAIYSELNRDTFEGDVVGPASSTDGDIAIFDGTTGKLLQDGGVGLPQNDGELIIGDTAGDAQINTITGGTGITVTNGAGSITIDADNNGDVTSSANLTDDAVVVGDGGAKGVKTLASLGTSGQVLTSNGAGTPPSFQDAGGGVSGPVSSTDNALSRWDGTSGDTLQDSTVIVTDNGEMTNASQPIFYAFLGTTDADVTGDGTEFFLGDTDVGTALTEVTDQGGNFTPGASGGAFFTAPVDGNYQFNFSLLLQDYDASATSALSIVTTSDIYTFGNYAAGQPAGNFPLGFSICVPMSATDTARFSVESVGTTKTIDVNGASDNRTNVSGFLVG